MDVDDAPGVGADKPGREYLHVAGEYDEIYRIGCEEFKLFFFARQFGGRRDGHVVEGDLMEVCQRLRVGMITDDEGQVAMEFTGLLAVEQVRDAMESAGDEDGDVLRGVDVVEPPVHVELFGEGGECGAELRFVTLAVVQGKFDAHKE